MPIIEPLSSDEPLCQGDLLRGVQLFATRRSWENGGENCSVNGNFCLVMSRPCVVAHKLNIVVALITKYTNDIPSSADSFTKILKFLCGTRDGTATPDLFYIGELPEHQGRFAARLDSLHTIEIPALETEARADFVRDHRIGTLNGAFRRDLHVRVFRAFASSGFDDIQWMSDDDLNLVVSVGSADLSKAVLALNEAHAAKTKREWSSRQSSKDSLQKAENKVEEIRAQLQPYLDEQQRRREG